MSNHHTHSIEDYQFNHGFHRVVSSGKYVALHPHYLGRPLTHEEMDFNLLYAEQTLAGFRIFGSNSDLSLSDDDLGKSLLFHKIASSDSDFARYTSAGYTEGQYIWIPDCCGTQVDCSTFQVVSISAIDSGGQDDCISFTVDNIVATDSDGSENVVTPTPTATQNVTPTPTATQNVTPTPTAAPAQPAITPTPTAEASVSCIDPVDITVYWEPTSLTAIKYGAFTLSGQDGNIWVGQSTTGTNPMPQAPDIYPTTGGCMTEGATYRLTFSNNQGDVITGDWIYQRIGFSGGSVPAGASAIDSGVSQGYFYSSENPFECPLNAPGGSNPLTDILGFNISLTDANGVDRQDELETVVNWVKTHIYNNNSNYDGNSWQLHVECLDMPYLTPTPTPTATSVPVVTPTPTATSVPVVTPTPTATSEATSGTSNLIFNYSLDNLSTSSLGIPLYQVERPDGTPYEFWEWDATALEWNGGDYQASWTVSNPTYWGHEIFASPGRLLVGGLDSDGFVWNGDELTFTVDGNEIIPDGTVQHNISIVTNVEPDGRLSILTKSHNINEDRTHNIVISGTPTYIEVNRLMFTEGGNTIFNAEINWRNQVLATAQEDPWGIETSIVNGVGEARFLKNAFAPTETLTVYVDRGPNYYTGITGAWTSVDELGIRNNSPENISYTKTLESPTTIRVDVTYDPVGFIQAGRFVLDEDLSTGWGNNEPPSPTPTPTSPPDYSLRVNYTSNIGSFKSSADPTSQTRTSTLSESNQAGVILESQVYFHAGGSVSDLSLELNGNPYTSGEGAIEIFVHDEEQGIYRVFVAEQDPNVVYDLNIVTTLR